MDTVGEELRVAEHGGVEVDDEVSALDGELHDGGVDGEDLRGEVGSAGDDGRQLAEDDLKAGVAGDLFHGREVGGELGDEVGGVCEDVVGATEEDDAGIAVTCCGGLEAGEDLRGGLASDARVVDGERPVLDDGCADKDGGSVEVGTEGSDGWLWGVGACGIRGTAGDAGQCEDDAGERSSMGCVAESLGATWSFTGVTGPTARFRC